MPATTFFSADSRQTRAEDVREGGFLIMWGLVCCAGLGGLIYGIVATDGDLLTNNAATLIFFSVLLLVTFFCGICCCGSGCHAFFSTDSLEKRKKEVRNATQYNAPSALITTEFEL